MRTNRLFVAGLVCSLLAIPAAGQADEGDWKRGHVYYRMVCTPCHVETAGVAIGPNTRSRQDWTAYLQGDRHAKGKDSLKYYLGKAYRESIKGSNKAAEKYINIPEQALFDDLRAFVMRSAKDGDAPTGCR